MGRRFGKKCSHKKEKLEEEGDRPSDTWRTPYKEPIRENALFEKYYRLIVAKEEQDDFFATLQSPLPATFRIVSTGKHHHGCDYRLPESIKPLVEPISFVPNAWRLPTSRRELRKDATYNQVHSWLMQATEAGQVCRQEAVSMLPPLFLNIDSPDLVILDMCAAPGSKTAQLLEYLSASGVDDHVTGMVIANDADKNRAFMLHHQVRRLHSPAILVTCNDASRFPSIIDKNGRRVWFDRVLCDVPCSGDGTLRKTPSIWAGWTPNLAFGLHSLQKRILERGLQLLKGGGGGRRLVYSTCSLNPVEDEAVVCAVLNKFNSTSSTTTIRLVNVEQELRGLKVCKGMKRWSVMNNEGVFFDSCPTESEQRLQETFFPPANIESLNIDYTFRVLPHHQDTGGFYIAVFEKCDAGDDGAAEVEEAEQQQQQHHHHPGAALTKTPSNFGLKFDQFYELPKDSPLVHTILDKYTLNASSNLFSGSYLTRSLDHDGPLPRNIVFCTNIVASVIASTLTRNLFVVNCGVRAFERYEPSAKHSHDQYSCQYRILSELLYFGNQLKVVQVFDEQTFKDLINTDTTVKITGLDDVEPGGVIIKYKDNLMSVWKTGDGFVRPFISKQDRPIYLQSILY